MKRDLIFGLALIAALTACSKQEEEKPIAATPAATTSNAPAVETPSPTMIEKDYKFKGAGALRLTFPRSWADAPKRITEGRELVNVIEFTPFSGADFIGLLEVRNLGPGITKSFDIKASLMKAGQAELSDSVEQSIDIHDINGPEVTGGYYTVTDKRYLNAQPGPNEYRYLTQGYAKLGTMVLKFRLVSNQAPGEEKDALVEMVRTARFLKQ